MNLQEIRDRLEEGNGRFVNDDLRHKLEDQARRTELTKGQLPPAVILSCADSRVVPELTFDCGLGELFVLRVAGNVANTSTIASIEYIVNENVNKFGQDTLIVVMGHESCGAVKAAMTGGDNGYNLNHLLSHLTPALAACGETDVKIPEDVKKVVDKNSELNAAELMNRSTIISNAVNNGGKNGAKAKIISAYYNLKDGRVDFVD